MAHSWGSRAPPATDAGTSEQFPRLPRMKCIAAVKSGGTKSTDPLGLLIKTGKFLLSGCLGQPKPHLITALQTRWRPAFKNCMCTDRAAHKAEMENWLTALRVSKYMSSKSRKLSGEAAILPALFPKFVFLTQTAGHHRDSISESGDMAYGWVLKIWATHTFLSKKSPVHNVFEQGKILIFPLSHCNCINMTWSLGKIFQAGTRQPVFPLCKRIIMWIHSILLIHQECQVTVCTATVLFVRNINFDLYMCLIVNSPNVFSN